jgi:anti-sigma B factor antagonist
MADEKQTAWSAEGDRENGTVRITGEVDFTNSPDVRQWLKQFCSETQGDLEVDLTSLSYIDSSGLAVLIEVRKHLMATNRTIRIVGASSQVQKLFTLTQIGDLFGI